MSYTFDPGFSRGQVLGTVWNHPIEKTDPAVTGRSQVFTKKQFTDVHAKTGAVLSNEIVTCVAVPNDTGAPVLPGAKLVVKGYDGVVDEYLPAEGCPDKEVFWLVIDGPTQQPLGTRVSLGVKGTPSPRLVIDENGDEVPEPSGNPGQSGNPDQSGTTDPVDPAPSGNP